MQISDCPYVTKKCGTYAQCVNCAGRKKTVEIMKAEMPKYYNFLSADCAAIFISGVVNSLHSIGFITGAERWELMRDNAEYLYNHK